MPNFISRSAFVGKLGQGLQKAHNMLFFYVSKNLLSNILKTSVDVMVQKLGLKPKGRLQCMLRYVAKTKCLAGCCLRKGSFQLQCFLFSVEKSP